MKDSHYYPLQLKGLGGESLAVCSAQAHTDHQFRRLWLSLEVEPTSLYQVHKTKGRFLFTHTQVSAMVCSHLDTLPLHSKGTVDSYRPVQTALLRAMLQPQVPYDLHEILGTMDFPSQLEALVSAAKIIHTLVGGGSPQCWDIEITKIMFHILKSVV